MLAYRTSQDARRKEGRGKRGRGRKRRAEKGRGLTYIIILGEIGFGLGKCAAEQSS